MVYAERTVWATLIATAVIIPGYVIVIGRRDPNGAATSDIRDRDIDRMGGRVEHSLLVTAGLCVIALCAVGADVFWIANAMFLGFAISTFVGGIARLVAYRRGLV